MLDLFTALRRQTEAPSPSIQAAAGARLRLRGEFSGAFVRVL
jgi:hypothetical protein